MGAKCRICIQGYRGASSTAMTNNGPIQSKHENGSKNPQDNCGKSALQELVCDKAKIDVSADTMQLVYMNNEDDDGNEMTRGSIPWPSVPPMSKPFTIVVVDGQTVLGECQNKMGCGMVCSSTRGCQATCISDVITKETVPSPISKSTSRKLPVDMSAIMVGQFMRKSRNQEIAARQSTILDLLTRWESRDTSIL